MPEFFFVVIPLVIVGFLIYFLPSIVAMRRRHCNLLAIFFLNLFLGWSFLGWVAAFVWACTSNTKAPPNNPYMPY